MLLYMKQPFGACDAWTLTVSMPKILDAVVCGKVLRQHDLSCGMLAHATYFHLVFWHILHLDLLHVGQHHSLPCCMQMVTFLANHSIVLRDFCSHPP